MSHGLENGVYIEEQSKDQPHGKLVLLQSPFKA